MDLISRALLVVTGIAAITFPTAPPQSHARTRAVARYQSNEIEAYLEQTTLDYIRPGLKIKVNSVTIGADRKPVVDLTITDALDQPLDRLGQVTPGAISLSFVLSWFDPATRNYTSYITRN